MVEETENKSKISIWWDIENCHVPKDVDPHYITDNMTAALQRASLTGPTEIQVFGDTMLLPPITQRALSDTGITLNHVPRGNKDAADKAILVAMLLWALDNPPPANILLISGDGDFANALNRLKLKTYTIFLAIPAQFVKPALIGAAKKHWFWKDMAKGQLAEPVLSQSSGNASSMFHQRQGSSSFIASVTHNSVAGKECASPQGRISESKGANTTEHFRSLTLDNLSSAFSNAEVSSDNRNRSSSFITSVTHDSVAPKECASPQKRISESEGANTTEQFSSLTLDNHLSCLSSAGMPSDNRNGSGGTGNARNVPSDRNISPGGVSNISASNKSHANASQSQRHVLRSSSGSSLGSSGSSKSATRSMDFGPRSGENVESLDSSAVCNTTKESGPPHLSGAPAGRMERGPLKHITPRNNKGTNNVPSTKNTVPENRFDHNVLPHKHNASEYRNANNSMPPCPPTTSMSPLKAMMSNPEKMSHETCLDKIYSAMKTLERDMLAPTESNLSDCIQYWDSQHERVDVKQTLNKAADLQQVTKTYLGGGLVMFFPPKHKVPWNCVDPGNMQYNHSSDVWLELQQFLLYGEKKQAFLSSCSRYDAAMILKNSCSVHIQNLVVGNILNLLQQAMQERKWLKKNGSGWAPLVLHQKALLDRSRDEAQKGDLRPSSSHGIRKSVQPANAERTLEKDVIFIKLRGFLSQILKDGIVYDLSFLPKDFELSTGMFLDYQKLGYANLQEVMKELTDIAYVETTSSGISLLRLVQLNLNEAGLIDKNMADKENNVKALKQIQVVHELKSWLRYLMTIVKDGYDISRVHQDFLQARGKDLSKEGLDFSKLQCILKQFPDVIYIAKSSGGLWLAYPASHGVDISNKSSKSVAVSTS